MPALRFECCVVSHHTHTHNARATRVDIVYSREKEERAALLTRAVAYMQYTSFLPKESVPACPCAFSLGLSGRPPPVWGTSWAAAALSSLPLFSSPLCFAAKSTLVCGKPRLSRPQTKKSEIAAAYRLASAESTLWRDVRARRRRHGARIVATRFHHDYIGDMSSSLVRATRRLYVASPRAFRIYNPCLSALCSAAEHKARRVGRSAHPCRPLCVSSQTVGSVETTISSRRPSDVRRFPAFLRRRAAALTASCLSQPCTCLPR